MAYQSLILGILFSVGIFAVKSGIGVAYVVSRQNKKKAKGACWILFALAYLVVFAVAFIILRKVDLIQHLSVIQNFIKSGMAVHLIMAALMFAWGGILLKKENGMSGSSKGWLMLVVPCPVCITVILFSLGFLMAYFPDKMERVAGLLYFGFLAVSALTVVVLSVLRRQRQTSPESLLGLTMMLIAIYFFLSVTVMPQFADMDRIYRMALYEGKPTDVEMLPVFMAIIFTAMAFFAGYGFRLRQIRRVP